MNENQHPDRTDAYCNEAYVMGTDAAKAAATWVVDGNTPIEHVRRVVRMFDEGDPQLQDFLPGYPNLSGEWADDMTPTRLFRDITGRDVESEEDAEAMTTMSDAYEEGVSDHFHEACEAELRKWLPDERCDECGALIPDTEGAQLANRHHDETCSLYDPYND